ncbi:MAG: cyclic nucleotide-binding domain-containing protein [Oscillospiraceae bacterium]
MKKSTLEPKGRAALLETGLPLEYIANAISLSFERGEMLFKEGLPVEYLMIVISGKGQISMAAPNGKKLLMDFFGKGTLLGAVELPLNIPTTTDVQATEKTCCAAMPMEHCRKAFKACPAFSNHLTHILAEIVMRNSNNAAVNILSSLRERLCAYIVSTRCDGVFLANFSQLAEMLGISGRHMFRELKRLCADGIISKTPSGYIITNEASLLAIASNYYILRNTPR